MLSAQESDIFEERTYTLKNNESLTFAVCEYQHDIILPCSA